jgi:hypothetical protein
MDFRLGRSPLPFDMFREQDSGHVDKLALTPSIIAFMSSKFPESLSQSMPLSGYLLPFVRENPQQHHACHLQAVAEIPFRLSKPFLINLGLAPDDVKTRPLGSNS